MVHKKLDPEVAAAYHWLGGPTDVFEPDRHLSPKRDRQRVYFKALATLPKLQRIEGKYQLRQVTCRAAACPRQLQYLTPEEKKTDANLAVHLIDDALHSRSDSVVVVSGDSDLEPAVEWLRKNHPAIKVTVYIPTPRPRPHSAATTSTSALASPVARCRWRTSRAILTGAALSTFGAQKQ